MESGSEEVEAEPTGAVAVAAVGGGASAQELAQTLTVAADMAGDVGGDMGGDMAGDLAADQPEQGDLLTGDLLSLLQQPSCWDLPEG